MKTKILCTILALMIAAVGLSACGKKDAPADTKNPIAAEEDGQNPVMNFIGNYLSDRVTMLVEAQGSDEARVTVYWNTDAWRHEEWVLTGQVVEDKDGLMMRYTNGTYAMVTNDKIGNVTHTDEADGCTGTVWFRNDGTVAWTDDKDERVENLVFEWLPVMSNEETVTE